MNVRGRLAPIGPAKFEAKRPGRALIVMPIGLKTQKDYSWRSLTPLGHRPGDLLCKDRLGRFHRATARGSRVRQREGWQAAPLPLRHARCSQGVAGNVEFPSCWSWIRAWGWPPQRVPHKQRNILTLVHGDNYVSAGAGPDAAARSSAGPRARGKVSNRVLRATNEGWEYEADPRHAELVAEQLGLCNEKGVATPGVSGVDEDDLPDDHPLSAVNVRNFRAVAARCNYLGPDRPDAQFSIKECCRECRRLRSPIEKKTR